MRAMKESDRQEFVAFVRAASDAQVREIYHRELVAKRHRYAQIASDEAVRRGITID